MKRSQNSQYIDLCVLGAIDGRHTSLCPQLIQSESFREDSNKMGPPVAGCRHNFEIDKANHSEAQVFVSTVERRQEPNHNIHGVIILHQHLKQAICNITIPNEFDD